MRSLRLIVLLGCWALLSVANAQEFEQVNTASPQTLTNKTLTAPVLSGTVTGTYSLGGTPTLDANTLVTTGKTLTVGSNILYGAIADKLNAAHLAISSQVIGDVLYADSTTSFARLAAVADGQVLRSGGVGAAPLWGLVRLSGATVDVTGTLPCANGGTGLSSGTSGGILAFTGTCTVGSSAALTANALLVGGGAGVAPSALGSLGTTTTLLHGNAAGAPTFGAVVSGDLNLTSTTCTNQFLTALSSAAAGTCTTATLAGAQFANQGTTTTLLHGNAAGNPSFGAVVLGDTNITTTDVVQVYPAIPFCRSDIPSAQLLPERVAKGDWALSRTAAGAETYNLICHLPAPTRTTSGKGWKLTAFSIIQQITVAALTSNTFNDLSTVTYVNNVANAVADYGGAITITMPTATQANPYVTVGTVGTPAFMNTADAAINLDWTIVMQNTGLYRLYAISATWTEQL